MKLHYLALFVLAMTVSSAAADQAHWNQFRGPNGDGKTTAKLPVEFSETQNVRWKIPLPDNGWSSPVIWDNEVWLTTGSDEQQELRAICVDLDSGKILKNIKVFDMIETPRVEEYAYHSYNLNSPATPTSVVEEGRIYVHFGSQGIACLDTKTGEKIWERRDLNCYQPVRQGSSPIVDNDSVFIAYDGLDKQFFIALDKQTGETRWKMDRNVETDQELAAKIAAGGKPGDTKKAFATATLIDVNGQTQLVAPAAEATIAYNPSTGEELWRVGHPGGFNVAARPLYAHGMIYVFTSGITGHLLAVRANGTGDVTDTHVEWATTKSTPHIPSPIIVDDLMFLVTDKGIARCLNAKTGDEIWKKRLGGQYWASPLYADGQIYFSNKEGDVKVFAATRQSPTIVSNTLDASFIASPAVVGDSLLLRSMSHLYRIQEGYERTAAEVAADAPSRLVNKGKGKPTEAKGDGIANKADLDDVAARLKAAVASGKLSEEEAIAKYKVLAAGDNPGNSNAKGKAKGTGKGKGQGKAADGSTQFYSVVIGTLKSKEVELGEFTMDVDYVVGGRREVNSQIIGKTVKVTGVSGEFRDKLLLLRRGTPMKFRSGRYFPNSNSLGFGYKFHVLEATAPFDPADYGVPPDEFRGFVGVLRGEIVEASGYELLMRVDEVEELSDENAATDPQSIKGKRVRVEGFFDSHADAFNELHQSDTIRVSVAHRDRTDQAFAVTDVLEVIGGQD